jgi:hypothetical protein
MISFRSIRREVLAAEQRPPLFPYGIQLNESLFGELRERPHLQSLLKEIREEAGQAQLNANLPLTFKQFQSFEARGTRKEYENPYFERRGRLLALVLASVIDETDEYLEALENLIWEICNEYTWCLPACLPGDVDACRQYRIPPEQVVDLFAAETAHALAEALFLVGDRLNSWLTYRIRTEIERRVFRPLFHEPVHFHWESWDTNWSAVCAGAVGMAALLLEDDRERLAGFIERVVRSLECFLEGFGDDGGCAEGLGYWFYGFGYYVYFADMLAQYTGGKLDLMSGEKVRAIAGFPAAVSLSNNRSVNYSDSGRVDMHTGLLSRLADQCAITVPEMSQVPGFRADDSYRWPHVTRNIWWTDAALIGRPLPEATYSFDDLAIVVDRRRVADSTVAFSAKGGHNGESHNHNDLGHFIIHVAGENLLADLGAGLYTRDYFGEQRYSLIHNSAEGHSVPIINGHLQQAGIQYAAEVKRNEQEGNVRHYSLDLTRAYDDPSMRQFYRCFRWAWHPLDEEAVASLHLTDSFEFDQEPSRLEQLFISQHKPEFLAGRIVWHGGKGTVELQFDEDQFHAEVEELEDVQSQEGKLMNVYRVRLRAVKLSASITYSFVFKCKLEQNAKITGF